jgi:hypothetical protein
VRTELAIYVVIVLLFEGYKIRKYISSAKWCNTDEIGYERPTHYQELENIRPAPNVYDRLGKPKEPVSYIYLR